MQNVRLKIGVIGNPKSGKTSLIRKMTAPSEIMLCQQKTSSYEVTMHQYKYGSRMYTVQLWDCGNEHLTYHKHLRKAFFNNMSAALLVFDLSDEKWRDHVAIWVSQAYQNQCFLLYGVGTRKQNVTNVQCIEYDCNTFFQEYQIKYFLQSSLNPISFGLHNIFPHINQDRSRIARMSLAKGQRFDSFSLTLFHLNTIVSPIVSSLTQSKQ